MVRYLLSICLFSLPAAAHSQAQRPLELGAEYLRAIGKGYNTSRVAVRAESFSNKNSFSAGFTYVLPSKKSYSVAHGFGLYLGYRYSFSSNINGTSPFAGARVLFSFENFEGQTNANSFFITPWAEAGYHFMVKKYFYGAPSIGYGYTKKISRDNHSLNEDDGGRWIPSLSAGYRFK